MPFGSDKPCRQDMDLPFRSHGRCEPTVPPWYSPASTSQSPSTSADAVQPFNNPANLNIFDLFQDPQLLTMPFEDNSYQLDQQQPQQNGIPPTAENLFRMPDPSQQFSDGLPAQTGADAGMFMNPEALQMWSTVPSSFE